MWDSSCVSGSIDQSIGYTGRSGPILGLGFYLNSSPWRLGPAWAVLAGTLASQAPIWGSENLLRLGGSLLLADAVWGVFWQQTTPQQRVLPKRARTVVLPYSDTQSPLREALAGLRGEATGNGGETDWPGMLAVLGLAAVLSLWLGWPAVALSFLALVASVGVRGMVRRGKNPALTLALLNTGLPWGLGASLGWADGARPSFESLQVSLPLGLAFMALTWSMYRVPLSGSSSQVWPIWLGQVVVLVTLVAVGAPLALAVVGSLFVVPGLWLSRHGGSAQEVADVLRNSGLWWLASMLASALAVRL
jgi:hypothetical protein